MRSVRRLFPILLIILPGQAMAQAEFPIDQRSVLVGGSASYNRANVEVNDRDEHVTSIIINPSALVFITEGIAVGGEFDASAVWQGGTVRVGGGFGPAVAYYLGGPDSRVYPFARASVLYRYQDDTAGRVVEPDPNDVPGIGNNSFTTTNLRLSGGLALMMARNVAVTAEVYYDGQRLQYRRSGETIRQRNSSTGLRFGITAFVF